MGRPLRQDTIEAMGLVASGKELSKQVGYNKYRVKDSEDEIVRLAEVEDLEKGDVVLSLTDGNEAKPVLKIMKHLFQTADEAYVYELDADGHVVFEKEGVSISGEEPTPVEQLTFTINPTPADATVTLNGVAQSSLTADKGTVIAWEVAKEGYVSKSGSYTLNSNYTKNVELEEVQPVAEEQPGE